MASRTSSSYHCLGYNLLEQRYMRQEQNHKFKVTFSRKDASGELFIVTLRLDTGTRHTTRHLAAYARPITSLLRLAQKSLLTNHTLWLP